MTPDAVDLIPLRALNQVSYCPRLYYLYYLEYVEALMPINEFVEDGTFQHRRVNDAQLAGRTRKENDALHTRSVALSSERLGLTGVLDVFEEKGELAYPVEYKRSSGPTGEPGYWDNDAIQLCAQALLLEEELGRSIATGILYYMGSKRRVTVQLDAALRGRTLQAIELIRELRARPSPPEPLGPELRNRCNGCSLLTICQLEETLYILKSNNVNLKSEISNPKSESGDQASLPRVLPSKDPGAVVYLQEQQSHVGKRGEHLVVRKDGQELQSIPICSIRQVVVFGNVQVSTQALEVLAMAEIPVVFLTRYGKFIATLEAAPTKNVMLRADQYRVFADPVRALGLARAAVKAKIANQRTLLMRSLRSRQEEPDVVLTLINNDMLTPADFLVWREACQLTDAGRAQFFRAYAQRKATVVKHPVFGYTMSYSRMLEVQARMLAGYVRGDLPTFTGFTVR